MGTMERIECGKSYEVKEWLSEGYVELLKRAETITGEEADRLGWKTAAKLLLLREQYLSKINSQYSQHCGCNKGLGSVKGYHGCGHPFTVPDRNQHDFSKAVQKEFEAEL